MGNLGSSIHTIDGTEYSYHRWYKYPRVNMETPDHDHSSESDCVLHDSRNLRQRWRRSAWAGEIVMPNFEQTIPDLAGKSLVAV
jgi:hypothetical protein